MPPTRVSSSPEITRWEPWADRGIVSSATKQSAGSGKSVQIAAPQPATVRPSTLNFNRQILLGECGALVLANVAAPVVSHFTSKAALISSAAVAATLIGGSVGWIASRVRDQVRAKAFTAKSLAGDIAYFTPGALVLGLGVYDPALYLISHHLLVGGTGAWVSVVAGQVAAFALFLASLNLYRLGLLRFQGKTL